MVSSYLFLEPFPSPIFWGGSLILPTLTFLDGLLALISSFIESSVIHLFPIFSKSRDTSD